VRASLILVEEPTVNMPHSENLFGIYETKAITALSTMLPTIYRQTTSLEYSLKGVEARKSLRPPSSNKVVSCDL
jgi:hypothetical protein